jgi:hypothetical protein
MQASIVWLPSNNIDEADSVLHVNKPYKGQ